MSNFTDALSIDVLKESCIQYGIPYKWLNSKEECVKEIYHHFEMLGRALEFVCPECQADVPEVKRCPFCGTRFDGEPDQDPQSDNKTVNYGFIKVGGVTRGGMKKADGTSGKDLSMMVIEKMGIPKERYRIVKAGISLWVHNSHKTFAYLAHNKTSVKIYLRPKVPDFGAKYWSAIEPNTNKHMGRFYNSVMTIGNQASIDVVCAVLQESLRLYLDELNNITNVKYEGDDE